MRVSILSAVRDESLYLGEMIRSVRAQDHDDWELVIVDDGSTDDTAQLALNASESDERILAVRNPEPGKVRAFNLAFARATGDLVVLLGGDDILPPDSLSVRASALDGISPTMPAAAFFRLRTFSQDPRYDGMIVPRRNKSNRSGGSIIMNRSLAEVVFPVDPTLVAEDIWISRASLGVAEHIVDRTEIVLNYRIHSANSNPRGRPFPVMTEAMHLRHRALPALLDTQRFSLPAPFRANLAAHWAAEEARYAGDLLGVLRSRLPWIQRLAMASMTRPLLYRVRSRFYRLFSGRR